MKDKYSYIDTHAHVNINAFKDDFSAVIQRSHDAGVAMINVGTQQDTSQRAVELAQLYESGVYAIVGLHPVHTSASYHDESELGENMKGFTSRGEVFNKDFYRELAKSNKVVGIGECGLDYYRLSEGRGRSASSHMTERMKVESEAQYRLEKDTKAVQEQAFIEQIELANELGLPLMIHTRDSKGNSTSAKAEAGVGNVYDDTYAILKQYAKVPGNVHFYAGTYEQAKKFFELGFSVSFTGVITFAKDYEEVVRSAPIDMIHGETDCPYVAPVPYRGARCEPSMVIEVYKKIAEIRGEDEETVREQLLENARKLYSIV
jgi:TatD DNase family protein